MLSEISSGLWTFSAPHNFLGLKFGVKMSIVKMEEQELLIYSPVKLTDEIKEELRKLGKVKYIIAPNLFHHLFVRDYVETYPDAQLFGARGLDKKRPNLNFHGILEDTSNLEWNNILEQVSIQGMPALNETVFFHKKSRTLISCDLLLNLDKTSHFWSNLYLRLNGLLGKVGVSKLIKLVFKNKMKARKSLDQILAWDFDRIIISHGNIIETGGKKIIEDSYKWLG